MESVSEQPAFPPELERQIFEICALWRPVGIPKLMLVAWRVKDWVEPLLYRTIAVNQTAQLIPMLPAFTENFLSSAVKLKPSSFFRQAVRHLFLPFIADDAYQLVLSACTCLENLWVNDDLSDKIPLFAPLRLKQLYAIVSPLLRTLTPIHPFFSKITHLEVLDPPDDLENWIRPLSLIPQLTHLSFSDDEAYIPMCLELLEACKFLAVLVYLQYEPGPLDVADLSKDPRFVVMSCTYHVWDWQMGVYAGKDYWSRAESFIAKRRSGEMDPLQYLIPGDESGSTE
ncbi:hypothetical protein C8R44DRAFT_991359 [Mycena epipterygia]|nr:hypothetical protein C8R44DRAFT_991359 [Mycena epipterygia]